MFLWEIHRRGGVGIKISHGRERTSVDFEGGCRDSNCFARSPEASAAPIETLLRWKETYLAPGECHRQTPRSLSRLITAFETWDEIAGLPCLFLA